MNGLFEPLLLDALSRLITERSGLRIGVDKRADLENGVRAVSGELGFSDPVECAGWLVSSNPTPAQIRTLAAHLTVGETYFFREKASFQAIEQCILPELIRTRLGRDQRLRIWSAGCCTGEEPYSLAISLDRILPNSQGWDIRLLATDINPHFLEKAKDAVYGEWSFRDRSDVSLEPYFARTRTRQFRLIPRLRRKVTFAPLNLAEDIYPSPMNGTAEMDVILCRNMLMYLDEECASRVLRNLGRCLTDGGYLLLGAAETPLARKSDLSPANFSGVMAFRRRSGRLNGNDAPGSHVERATEKNPAMRAPIIHANPCDERRRNAQASGVAPSRDGLESNSLELFARTYANQGDLARAMECCEKLISIEKLNPRFRYLHAMILQERGDLEQAAAAFRRTIYLDPDHLMAHVGAGHLATRVGNHKEAEQHLRRARRLLKRLAPDQAVPEADGLDVQHLTELISRGAQEGTSQ